MRALVAMGKEWDERERLRAKGYISSEMLWDEKEEGRGVMIVRFASRDEYLRNASSPEQDAFYQRFRACLESEPEWTDGTFAQWDTPFGTVPGWAPGPKA